MKRTFKLLSALLTLACFALAAPQDAHAEDLWQEYSCVVQDIRENIGNASFQDGGPSIIVRCKNAMMFGSNTVNTIAVDARTGHAARFLSQAQAAMLSGKNFFAHISKTFVPPATNGLANCSAVNCRIVTHMFGIWH